MSYKALKSSGTDDNHCDAVTKKSGLDHLWKYSNLPIFKEGSLSMKRFMYSHIKETCDPARKDNANGI